MPIEPVFLAWVEDHPEARAIYRSVENFRMDRELAKQLAVLPARATVAEWEEQVRANCERGWPADGIERKYIPPDWNKVYPLLGGPPVWSTENIEDYIELLNDFTEMLEPRDMMELMWTKEAADATWEAGRKAREKNCLPERKYQQRLNVLAEVQRRNRAAETTAAKPATALDHSRGLHAGFKYYQALDIAQSRAIKRRDNALRQIARWRDGPGAKARRLADKFVAEQALAESYCAMQALSYAEFDNPVGEAKEAAPPLAPVGDVADIAPAVPPSDETAADIAPAVPTSGGLGKHHPRSLPLATLPTSPPRSRLPTRPPPTSRPRFRLRRRPLPTSRPRFRLRRRPLPTSPPRSRPRTRPQKLRPRARPRTTSRSTGLAGSRVRRNISGPRWTKARRRTSSSPPRRRSGWLRTSWWSARLSGRIRFARSWRSIFRRLRKLRPQWPPPRRHRNELSEANRSQSEKRAKKQRTAHSGRQSSRQLQ